MKKMKLGKKVLLMAAMICFLSSTPLSTGNALAAEQVLQEGVSQLNQIMTAIDKTEAKEAPSDTAAVVFSYEKDASVFVTGETDKGWFQVSFQDKVGFVKKEALNMLPINAALEEEFKNEEAESKMVVEEIERYRAESRRSKIWGAAIILLIVGIFATGIISTIKNEREDAKQKEKASQKESDEDGISEETPIREVRVEVVQPVEAKVHTIVKGDSEPEDLNVIDLDKE